MKKSNSLPPDEKRVDVYYGRKSTGRNSEDEEAAAEKAGRQAASLGRQRGTFDEFYGALSQEKKTKKLIRIEEAKSAFVPGKREGFDDVVGLAETCGINILYIDEPKRLIRNHEECGKAAQLLADGRINEVVTMCGKRYMRTDSGQLLLFLIEGGMAWKESADKGWMVSKGMLKKAKEGGCTGWAPLGYQNVCDRTGEKKWMEIDPAVAPKVKRLFLLASTGGYSLEALTKEAKKLRLRSRPTKKHPNGLLLQKTTIAYILKNHDYKGVKFYKDAIYPAQHQALVSTEVWNKVQIEMSKRSTNAERPKDISLQDLFLMAGCIRCGKCKTHSMTPYKVKKGRYVMYECKNRKTKCRNCINQTDLFKQFTESLEALAISEDEYAYMRKTLKKVHEEGVKHRIDERKNMEREYQSVDQQIADVFMNIEEARRQGIYDTVSMKLAQLRMRKDEIKIALDALHHEGDEWIDHVIQCFELAKVVHRAIQVGSPTVRQAVLKSLGSSYYVIDKKLVVDWVSPFKERMQNTDGTIWLPRLDSNQ